MCFSVTLDCPPGLKAPWSGNLSLQAGELAVRLIRDKQSFKVVEKLPPIVCLCASFLAEKMIKKKKVHIEKYLRVCHQSQIGTNYVR
jgi:hypothetical protein